MKDFHCPICGKNFVYEKSFYIHLNKHEAKGHNLNNHYMKKQKRRKNK